MKNTAKSTQNSSFIKVDTVYCMISFTVIWTVSIFSVSPRSFKIFKKPVKITYRQIWSPKNTVTKSVLVALVMVLLFCQYKSNLYCTVNKFHSFLSSKFCFFFFLSAHSKLLAVIVLSKLFMISNKLSQKIFQKNFLMLYCLALLVWNCLKLLPTFVWLRDLNC